jgi:glycosyltransferase involved in cell wall biosynthesis
VIDDGSSDATAEVAARAGAVVIRHSFNLGYGAALQTGYKYARQRGASLLAQMDADGQHDPTDLPKLLAPIRAGECDLMIGSRFLASDSYETGALKHAGHAVFRAAGRLFGLRITDPTSGFQAMNRAVLDLYVGDAFPSDYPDVNALMMVHRAGLRIAECPVEMSAGLRASSLHVGLKPVYYVYKMLISIWAASSRTKAR